MRHGSIPVVVLAMLLGLPAASYALPIEEPPRPERLVEGHTVFLAIDAHAPVQSAARTFASREGSGPVTAQETTRTYVTRIPGVLWFNDQYLVPPVTTIDVAESLDETVHRTAQYGASIAVLVRGDDGRRVRDPCGGAVLATNAGDIDPRTYLATEFALEWSYLASYLVADPNQHDWVVDKYELALPSPHLVWVVNILGAPVFSPDLDGTPVDDCLADKAVLEGAVNEPARAAGLSSTTSPTCPIGVTPTYTSLPSWTDDPCMGALEPSWGRFCYRGPAVADEDGDGDHDRQDCSIADQSSGPRRYQALLYFDWADLTVAGSPRDHASPFWSSATNGCSHEQYWWGPNPSAQYPCPGGDDDEEGDSHGFHPFAPVHEEAEPCADVVGGPNPTNHGGSLTGVCDYLHATASVDVYYSGSGRPPEPAQRELLVTDTLGDSDPFADFHSAYGSP